MAALVFFSLRIERKVLFNFNMKSNNKRMFIKNLIYNLKNFGISIDLEVHHERT